MEASICHSDADKGATGVPDSNPKMTPFHEFTLKQVLFWFERFNEVRHSVI